MHHFGSLLLLVVAVTAVAAVARRRSWSAPVLLVVVGLLVSALPGVPRYHLDPEVVLVLFLPPLVYSAAVDGSVTELRENLRAITLLSVGLVLFMTVAVGAVARLVVPGLPLAAALALGAILAPTDAVAATAVARRLGVPRRVVTVLEGESLFNDATALVVYAVAVDAVATGSVSAGATAVRFAVSVAGGLAVGLVVALGVASVRRHTDDPLLENTLSLLTPFLAYLPAEALGASGVLAVVVTGLWLGRRSPVLVSPAARLQAQAIWSMVDFLLTGVVFALIGLQLPDILTGLRARPVSQTVGAAVAVSAALVLARLVWVFPATYLPRALSRRIRTRDPRPPWQQTFLVGWAGMRGVVSLAAAFALPLTVGDGRAFPARDLLLLLTLVGIVVTLVLQGLPLPWLVRRLHLRPDADRTLLQEAAAQQRASAAALERLEQVTDGVRLPPGVLDRLRGDAERRQMGAWERLGGGSGGTLAQETPSAAYRRLRREMVVAERAAFVQLRDRGEIGDEVLRRVQRDLDLEESVLARG